MARRRKGRPIHGWIVLDKPLGLSSSRAVAAVKRALDAAKAGHAGTLDPLATGLLPIALGEATKVSSFAMAGAKSYRFTVRWGTRTETDDSEGAIIETSDKRPTADEIADAATAFEGTISQVPPQFSAIKVSGERAYAIARGGGKSELEAREITVDRLALINASDPDCAVFEVDCGKGTYVRAIARDLGAALGCCGHVEALRRTRVGPWSEADGVSLEMLQDTSPIDAPQEAWKEYLRPVATALDDIPALAVSSADAARLKRGQPLLLRGRDAPSLQGTVFVESRGEPVALAEARQGALHPKRVFNMTV